MSIQARSAYRFPNPGPYLAKVTNHLDTTYMGGLEVSILKGYSNNPELQSQTFPVNYLSPFYGISDVKFEGNDPANFNDVQKSYGMWMIPPDVGTTVMVIFLEGDPNQGYWMGCVLGDRYQNHMVPGIAASTNVAMTPEQKVKYGVTYLPVAELHKGTSKTYSNANSVAKPIHPFADKLLKQGLLADTIRGVTSSSARREVPSAVFGISTPGRTDPDGRKGEIGYTTKITVPVSRLGGHTFVMDDGDQDKNNQLVRLRSSSGHQILMHDTKNLIYIGNSDGTAWIEMTAAGKIDIYTKDSVSIHSETDFNFRADRDINIEAGRNINIKSAGSMNTDIDGNYNVLVGQDGKLTFNGAYDSRTNGNMKFTTGAEFHLVTGSQTYITSDGNINLYSSGSNNFTATADTNIRSVGTHKETASLIAMNGTPAAYAALASAAATPAALPLFAVPSTSILTPWANKNFYQSGTINSIMQRVPMHEPWTQHESIAPEKFSSERTDTVTSSAGTENTGSNPPLPPPNGDQPAQWSQDCDFIAAVKSLATTLNSDYLDLLACMAFETGSSFDPAKRNPASSATGLIQFIRPTAIGLGTTVEQLALLTRTQQMVWVEKYFKQGKVSKLPAPTLEDLYMQILWPAAVGQENDYVLFKSPNQNYAVNSGLDASVPKKGYVTKADAAAKVRAQLPYVRQQISNSPCTT